MSDRRLSKTHIRDMDEKQLELYYARKAKKYQKKIKQMESYEMYGGFLYNDVNYPTGVTQIPFSNNKIDAIFKDDTVVSKVLNKTSDTFWNTYILPTHEVSDDTQVHYHLHIPKTSLMYDLSGERFGAVGESHQKGGQLQGQELAEAIGRESIDRVIILLNNTQPTGNSNEDMNVFQAIQERIMDLDNNKPVDRAYRITLESYRNKYNQATVPAPVPTPVPTAPKPVPAAQETVPQSKPAPAPVAREAELPTAPPTVAAPTVAAVAQVATPQKTVSPPKPPAKPARLRSSSQTMKIFKSPETKQDSPLILVSGLAYHAFLEMIESLQEFHYFNPKGSTQRYPFLSRQQQQAIAGFRQKVFEEKNIIAQVQQFQSVNSTDNNTRLQGFSHHNLLVQPDKIEFTIHLNNFYKEFLELSLLSSSGNFAFFDNDILDSYRKWEKFFTRYFIGQSSEEADKPDYGSELDMFKKPDRRFYYRGPVSPTKLQYQNQTVFRDYRMYRGVSTLQVLYRTNNLTYLVKKLKEYQGKIQNKSSAEYAELLRSSSSLLTQKEDLKKSTTAEQITTEMENIVKKAIEKLEQESNIKETPGPGNAVPSVAGKCANKDCINSPESITIPNAEDSLIWKLPLTTNKNLIFRSQLCSYKKKKKGRTTEMFTFKEPCVLSINTNNYVTTPVVFDNFQTRKLTSLSNDRLEKEQDIDKMLLGEPKSPTSFTRNLDSCFSSTLSTDERKLTYVEAQKGNRLDSLTPEFPISETNKLILLGSDHSENNQPPIMSHYDISNFGKGNPMLIYVSPESDAQKPSKTHFFWNWEFQHYKKAYSTSDFPKAIYKELHHLDNLRQGQQTGDIRSIFTGLKRMAETITSIKTENLVDELIQVIS